MGFPAKCGLFLQQKSPPHKDGREIPYHPGMLLLFMNGIAFMELTYYEALFLGLSTDTNLSLG